jgi:hypothetical protein
VFTMGVFSPTAESLLKFTRAFYADSFYLTAQPPQTRLRHPCQLGKSHDLGPSGTRVPGPIYRA